jgi:hypothetical protein
VFAVGYNRFAFGQQKGFFRPVHSIAEAIRHIEQTVLIKTDYPSPFHLKIFIVLCHHGIMRERILQIGRALNAAGYHGIGIEFALRIIFSDGYRGWIFGY